MRPLRILMLTTFYPPFSFGGDAVVVQRMARALAARGHEVTVAHDVDAFLTLGGASGGASVDDPPLERTGADGVRVIGLRSRLGALSSLLTQQAGRPVVHGTRLRRIAAEGRHDVVWHNNVSLLGGPGLLGLGTGLRVYEAHEHWLVCPTHVLMRYGTEPCDARDCLRCQLAHRRPPQLWRRTGALDRGLDGIDLLIAKSRFSRDKHRAFGLRQEMEVLPPFLPDLDPAAVAPAPHPRPYFLFVGRLERIKGLQDAIPAMARHPGADLVAIGDGDFAAPLRAQAAGDPRIRFLGRMPPDDLAAWYKGALALLVPSICYETFGAILIEAFRLGTPVIARRLGPFPEIVEAAGGGLLFDDQDGLVAAMAAIQGDPSLRARLSAAAREAFGRLWREDRVLADTAAAFARAARRKGDLGLARRLEASGFEDAGFEDAGFGGDA